MAELEDAMSLNPTIVGVNSRDLKTLSVHHSAFAEILPQIPETVIAVAESGISSRADVEYATRYGARALLIGEALVRSSDPAATLKELRG